MSWAQITLDLSVCATTKIQKGLFLSDDMHRILLDLEIFQLSNEIT